MSEPDPLAAAFATRWAWVEIDEAAIAHNVAHLRAQVAPSEVWAIVKANGYGHGTVAAARAALAGGATGLGVALVQEGIELRQAGFDVPVLVLSPQPPDQMELLIGAGLTPTLHDERGIEVAADAARRLGRSAVGVHLKFDTGMGRVGAAPAAAVALARAVAAAPEVRLDGVFTHLAVADEPGDEYTAGQLAAFDAVLAALVAEGVRPPLVHAANSAGGLAHAAARHDVVRVGIAAYGIEPGPGVAAWTGELRPALRLVARVSHVKQMPAGARLSYGLRHTFDRETTVATVPIGYADGVPRRLSATGGAVLIAGSRCPIVGVVTMDQLMVACPDPGVAVGDEVVLLGAQGTDRIRPEEWADRLGTIAYEIVCGLSRRIERRPAPR